jgi:hypothetical protein
VLSASLTNAKANVLTQHIVVQAVRSLNQSNK